MNLKQLLEKRAKLAAEARAILDTAQTANAARDLTDEERTQFDMLQTQLDALTADIARTQGFEAREAELNRSQGRLTPPPDPNIGMSEQDVRAYSIVRAIRALADQQTGARNAFKDAGLELEASRAVAARLGKEPQGIYVPYDWQRRSIASMHPNADVSAVAAALVNLMKREKRDLLVGTATAGGHTVATDLLAQDFIDVLRNRIVVQQAGATMLSGLVGNIAIPRKTAGTTHYWVAENGSPTESQSAFDQVTMTPKTVGAFSDFSRRLLNQSSLDVEALVRDDLTRGQALAIDRAALHGTGASNQPTGVALVSGIGSVAGGTNGLAPTWDHIVGLETEVAIDNADVGTLAYITNARVRGRLKRTSIVSGQNGMVWAGNSAPVNGYDAWVTNQVRSDLDKGSSTGVCSAIFFGNWADLVIGMWGGLDLLVDPFTGSTAGTVRVVALQDVDIAVRHPESFAAMLDALTV